jgi:hypothetical protein
VTVGPDWQIEQVGTAQELMSGTISPELVASISS